MSRDLRRYFEQSRSLSVSLVLVLPLLLVYEGGILLFHSRVVNHAGALVRQMIALFGFNAYLILTAGVAAAFVVALLTKKSGAARGFSLYWLMIFEAGVYGALLGPVASVGPGLFRNVERGAQAAAPDPAGACPPGAGRAGAAPARRLAAPSRRLAASPPAGNGKLLTLLLYVGAGVWEEIVFRFALMGGLIWLFVRVLGGNRTVFTAISVLVAALAFSAFHHLGPLGDPFDARVFVFRTLAGVALGLIYLLRGLGICVYTHAFYNVALLLLPL
jgi:hypothetical protein